MAENQIAEQLGAAVNELFTMDRQAIEAVLVGRVLDIAATDPRVQAEAAEWAERLLLGDPDAETPADVLLIGSRGAS